MSDEARGAPWRLPGDTTRPVITAEGHARSSHRDGVPPALPEGCVLFEMGGALSLIEAEYPARAVAERLPCFIADARCVTIDGLEGWCFVHGGYGAPAAVDALETLRALGVRRVVVAGLCGGFAEGIGVGDLVAPTRVYSEEGTSRHYFEQIEYAVPDERLRARATAYFSENYRTLTNPTVTCDAIYRQTFAKEAHWRSLGCVGVDMEASALLSVSHAYAMPAAALLLCSDRHPLQEEGEGWAWGDDDFAETRRRFVRDVVAFARALAESPPLATSGSPD